jgi:glycosyltransferase involved in cell wall biosynthesis
LEKSLVNRSDIVFVSSDYLSSKLTHRYGNQISISVVNNAIFIPEHDQNQDSTDILRLEALMDSIAGKKLMYLGGISEWMDFDLILRSVEQISEITYVFVGPCDVSVPRHERIIFFGPIEHRNIFRAMKKADALIMPFRINELIKSVNPVKVYDYIYSCKPTIVVGYAETAKFESFIHLYRTPEEYIVKLKMLVTENLEIKKNSNECINFASQNTWLARVEQMLPVLNSIGE